MTKDIGRVASPNRLSSPTEPQGRLGPPGFEPARSRIWSYAAALGKPLIQVAPEDFELEWVSGRLAGPLRISCTIATTQEAEAVCEIIKHMALRTLTSHRKMVRGDIYPDEPKPSFREELERMLGPVAAFARDTEVRQPIGEVE